METESRLPIENDVLRAIKQRRSILRFVPGPVEEEKIQAILEAGRWAPSFGNIQPWEFIVVKDTETKQKIGDIARNVTIGSKGIEGAAAVIVTCVNEDKDPYHFVEAGAVATQNMALAAHSLGLASYWTGIYDLDNSRDSAEWKVKTLLSIPNNYRVISFLPIGAPAYKIERQRRSLGQLIHYDQFGKKP